MAQRNAKTVIEQGEMRRAQWGVVAITVALNALDGFDILSISFASPGIAREWGLSQSVLGWLLSMELLGMALGSIMLGSVADRIGRRPTILACLVAMTIGMFGAGGAANLNALLGWRLVTGLGIGGMLAAINAVAAEMSNVRARHVAMALMVIGYPLGGVFGGLVVQNLLIDRDWRSIFDFGAMLTAMFIPLVLWLVPETPAFLDRTQPKGALARINHILARLGHAPVAHFSPQPAARAALLDLFRPHMVATSLIITFAFFAHIMSFYFMLKWVPKIVVDMGHAPHLAAQLLTWANVGGAAGGALFGWGARALGLRRLTIITLAISTLMIIWFGSGADNLGLLRVQVASVGLCTNAAIVGLYALAAQRFPTQLRATGTGFAIGFGRIGAVLAPVIGGYLFEMGFGLQRVALLMALGSLLSALALSLLKPERDAAQQ